MIMRFNPTPNLRYNDMPYRSFGRTGVFVSELCLGTMNFGGKTPEADSIQIMNAALEAGINFWDTANVYNDGESEKVVGKALAGKRDEVFLATKVYFPVGDQPNQRGLSRYHIIRACEDSLRRLQTDHIDLYQLHRPMQSFPQDETLRALDDLVKQGKVRYIGVSTFPAWKTVEGIHLSERYGLNRYVSEQPPYNLLDRRIENELVPMALEYNLAILPWSPLGGGVLAGKYPPGETVPAGSRLDQVSFYKERGTALARQAAAKIGEIAKEVGMTLPELALLWVKEQPGITSPIIGPRTMEHLQSALNIAGRSLDDEVTAMLDDICPPGSAIADFHNTSTWMKQKVLV
jgi:aryl-alcohol dehydrogenase-like predicted oxidoreductase